MSERALVDEASVPKLGPHMRLRHDKARDTWTIQAPERSFMLDPIAHQVVSRCDGAASVAQVVDSLCAAFPDAPRDLIAGDVAKLIQDFVDKSVMVL
jgi:pyrroloquinoline quinone biosynthesis protein D